jgi:quaternary ammonium compound-resistance protein SugE
MVLDPEAIVSLDPGAARQTWGTTLNHYWIMLLIAAGLEIVWAIGLKYTEGFTRLWPSVGTVLAMAASMYLLARAAEGLPIGTAYAVWTGIGAVGTAVVGMLVLNEPRDWTRLACVGLIILGVVGLKSLSREDTASPAGEAVSRLSG